MPIIYDDGNGNTILTYNVIYDECGDLLTGNLFEGKGFNLLQEILSGSDFELMAIGGWRVNLSH